MDVMSPKNKHLYFCCVLVLTGMLIVWGVYGCEGSSSTRSAAKDATSGDYEIQLEILSPVDGATVVFVQKEGADEPESDVEFTYSTSGGTEPVIVTWLIQGPSTSNSSSASADGDATLTFLETGVHKITAVATDSNGITASDSITITIL
ncbi:MAG: hypothetical protein JRH18_08240 [Deltaproteobacteria bacterium]|nr:hypothetical protein [Deltaproteobacteria bacterium]MBW1993066.1 hypothetical protein [Deltaproteobacteria bacterium]MBW2151641.1 hypothetical protein [Deltaproteobacteria bacterium]